MIYKEREDLTKEIKSALKGRGLNIVRLADLLGVIQQSAQRTVTKSDISIGMLKRICDELDADLEISIKLRDG